MGSYAILNACDVLYPSKNFVKTLQKHPVNMKKVKLNNKYKSTALLNGKNSQKTNIDKK